MNTGKEAIESLSMGVALLFFGIVVFFAARNVRYGKLLLGDANDTIDTIQYQSQDDNFKSMKDWNKMSAVTAYALLGYNQESIDTITCEICGQYNVSFQGMDSCCVKNHLMGDVQLRAVKNIYTSQYHIDIKEVH